MRWSGRLHNGVEVYLREEIIIRPHFRNKRVIALLFCIGHHAIFAAVFKLRLSVSGEFLEHFDCDHQ